MKRVSLRSVGLQPRLLIKRNSIKITTNFLSLSPLCPDVSVSLWFYLPWSCLVWGRGSFSFCRVILHGHVGGVSHVSQAGKPKTYSLLVLPDPAVFCLGTIGKSNSGVCIKKDCQTNHIGDKQGWTDETLVIIKSTNVAFSKPTLKTNKLSQELKSQFLSENKTLDDWHLLFAYVDELEAPVTIKDLDQRLAEKLAAETFIKTPLVKRKPSSEDDESSYVEVSPFRPTMSFNVSTRWRIT